MLAYKCKSLYVLWNRIIIVLIYQPCTVPGDGWEILAKKGLYFQQKNRFAELYKNGWNNQMLLSKKLVSCWTEHEGFTSWLVEM